MAAPGLLGLVAFLASLGECWVQPAGICVCFFMSLVLVSKPEMFPCLPPAAVCSSQTSDCSYFSLLKHLNLSASQNLLAVTRPVKDWRTPTAVYIDMLLYGILQVVRGNKSICYHHDYICIFFNVFNDNNQFKALVQEKHIYY